MTEKTEAELGEVGGMLVSQILMSVAARPDVKTSYDVMERFIMIFVKKMKGEELPHGADYVAYMAISAVIHNALEGVSKETLVSTLEETLPKFIEQQLLRVKKDG